MICVPTYYSQVFGAMSSGGVVCTVANCSALDVSQYWVDARSDVARWQRIKSRATALSISRKVAQRGRRAGAEPAGDVALIFELGRIRNGGGGDWARPTRP